VEAHEPLTPRAQNKALGIWDSSRQMQAVGMTQATLNSWPD